MRCPSAKCVKAVFKTQLEVCTYNMLWYMNPDGSRTQTPHVMLYEILETWKSDSVLCLTSSLYSTIGFSELKIIRPAKSILCLSFACFLEKSTCPMPPTVFSESVSRLQCWSRNDIFAAILPTPVQGLIYRWKSHTRSLPELC